MNFINKYDINIETLFYYSIIFWPIIFTINEFISFPTVLLTLISFLIMIVYLYKNDKPRFKVFSIAMGIVIVTQLFMVFTGSTFTGRDFSYVVECIKFIIRWAHLIAIFYIFSSKKVIDNLKSYAIKSVKYIFITSIIIVLIQTVYVFLNAGYESVWKGLYFKAYLYSPHVNSYFLMLPMCSFLFCFFVYKDNLKKGICIFGAIMTIGFNLLTGARTTGIIAIALFGVIILKILMKNKKVLLYSIGVLVAIFVINVIFNIVDLTKIPLVKKTIDVLNDPSGFLNGRNYIWGNMITYFQECFNGINYVFGVGLSQSMRINDLMIGQALWAHSDIFETLIGTGICGLAIYLYTFVKYFYNNKALILSILVFVILFFNGLFVYSELVTFIPFITVLYGMKLHEK